MFQNSYQNGSYFEVFDPKASQDKCKSLYKLQNVQSTFKVFDKDLKTFIFQLNHSNSKIVFPKEDKKQLYLIQQYLNLQIQFTGTADWNIELTVNDLSKTKRRIILSPSFHKTQIKPFFIKFPCTGLTEGVWLNFVVDLYSFMGAFKNQTYRSLDGIQISGNLKLRRIFTTHNLAIQDQDNHIFQMNLLPKILCFSPQTLHSQYFVKFQNNLVAQQNSQIQSMSSKSNIDIVSSKNIKNSKVGTMKSIKNENQPPKSTKTMQKQIKPAKLEKQTKELKQKSDKNQIKQVKTLKQQQQVREIKQTKQTKQQNAQQKDQRKFLASTNGLEMRKNRKQSAEVTFQQQRKSMKLLSNKKQSNKKASMPKPQINQNRISIQKNKVGLKQKQKQKQKQGLNPWRNANNKKHQTGRYQPSQKLNIIRKVQSAQTSLYDIKNNLNKKLNNTNSKEFERKSDCWRDSDYVQLSQKFSTVSEGKFYKNVIVNSNSKQQTQKQTHDEIEEDIQIQSNSYYSNSNKKNIKDCKAKVQLCVNDGPICESIRDSLDQFEINNKKQKFPLQNESYMNMSRLGVGDKMMRKYMQQIQRPYSPPLGERQHMEESQPVINQPQQRQVQLMYDPVLNCYYDHKTHTYYELKN